MADGPRRLVFPAAGTGGEETASSPPRRLVIPEAPPAPPPPARPVATTPERSRTIQPPPPAAAPPVRAERARTRTDDLLDKAATIDATVPATRLRGRIDTILPMAIGDILDWGQRNLTPLQETSSHNATLVADISRINALHWLTEAKNASCKVPSFMDRLAGRAQSPDYYEKMLLKARGDLLNITKKLDDLKREFAREVGDLHCDAISMLVCSQTFTDVTLQSAADNRARSLMMAHQTAATLQHSIERAVMQAAQWVQQIDEFMSVTMPNWKMAFSTK